MINLLPSSQKKELASEYRWRAFIVLLAGIFILELLAAASLGFIYQLISGNVRTVSAELVQRKQLASTSTARTLEEMHAIKANMDRLVLADGEKQLPTQLLRDLSARKPSGIVITRIAYDAAGKEATLRLSGTADFREDLIFFQDNLRTDERFTDLSYDQNFVRQKRNIDFSLTIKLK